MPKTKSSRRWLNEHHTDLYVKRAKKEGRRARSYYKLEEMQKRYRFIKPGMLVIDLGSAPGGWSEFAKEMIGKKGKIFAIDILPMQPIVGVEFFQGDFTDPKTNSELCDKIGAKNADLILSDMAPNMSGLAGVDQARAIGLAESALAFAEKMLKPNGALLLKIFQGERFADFLKKLRSKFASVNIIKPPASRSRSKEIFLLANGLKSH